MFNLSNFPASILDRIIGNRDTSWAIIKLWLCGDRLLNEKLSQGLTYVHLTHRHLAPATFPRLLFKLRFLRHLSIQSNTELNQKLADWPLIMSSLSQSLETLQLEVPDASRFLTNYALNPAGEAEPVTSNYARGSCKYIDMDRIFPRLHTLSLWHYSTTLRSPLYFAALPSNLTCLNTSVTLDYTEPGVSYMSALPRTLLRLKGSLKIEGNAAEDWTSVPPHLEEIPDFRRGTSFDGDYSWLPKTLQSGKLSFPETFPFSLSSARALPLLLPSLVISFLDPNVYQTLPSTWMQHLPTALKRLELSCPLEGLNSLPYLPKTLTSISVKLHEQQSFDLRSLIPDSKAASSFWPPSLTKVSWTCLHPNDLDLLPRSTTKLFIEFAIVLDATGAFADAPLEGSLLPPLLTKLVLSSGPVALTGKLPSNLLEMTLLVPKVLDGFRIENLPDSLTSANLGQLALYQPDIGYEVILEKFPTNLTSLNIRSWPCDGLNFIPRTLRSLMISYLVGIPESELIPDGRVFENLPVSLTSLHIRNSVADIFIPLQRVSHLTKLERLDLMYASSMSSSMLRELPPLLIFLILPISIVADEDAPFLPCRLRTLMLMSRKFEKAPITPALALHWPLRALDQLYQCSLTPELFALIWARLADPLLSSYTQAKSA